MKIHESGENYLETILILQKEMGSVRSIDVANRLDYSKASISRAMGILKREGYITMEDGGNIQLTEMGKEKAQQIYERHCLIAEFFVSCLEVDPEVAEDDACRIEHVISEETFDQMKLWIQTAKEFDSLTGEPALEKRE